MIAKYFNKWEFRQAISCISTDPLETKIRLEEYLEKYPKDYLTYSYYVATLIKLGEFDEAEKILEYAELIFSKDGHFANEFNKIKSFKERNILLRIKLLSYQEKYEEAYQLCLEHWQEDINNLLFYCKKKLGKLDIDKREKNSYLFRQIVEYKESDFLEHVKKHQSDYNQNADDVIDSIFVPNFPIEQIVEEIKKYIPSEKRLFFGYFEDVYVFKYNECGRNNNKLVDYFKVVCFHNTSDFITLCPVMDYQNLPYVDLNYLVCETKNIKTKRKSQIEKFNQRYKI